MAFLRRRSESAPMSPPPPPPAAIEVAGAGWGIGGGNADGVVMPDACLQAAAAAKCCLPLGIVAVGRPVPISLGFETIGPCSHRIFIWALLNKCFSITVIHLHRFNHIK